MLKTDKAFKIRRSVNQCSSICAVWCDEAVEYVLQGELLYSESSVTGSLGLMALLQVKSYSS